MTNNNIWNCLDIIYGCVYLGTISNNNQFQGGIINLSASNLIYFYNLGVLGSNNNIFKDLILSGATKNDTKIDIGTVVSTNNTFLNVTYDSSKEYVAAGSELIRKWYLDVSVKNNTNALEGAAINSNSLLQTYHASSLSDSNGNSRQELLDYINNGGVTSYKNYNINVSKTGFYNNISAVEMSQNRNLLIGMSPIVSIIPVVPVPFILVDIIYPTAGFFKTGFSALNYTASSNVTLNPLDVCWYSRDNGLTNSTPPVSAGINFTGLTSVEGSNTWTVYCRDNLGNISSDSVYFVKDSIKPFVNLTSPANGAFFSGLGSSCNNIVFRFDASDSNLDACYAYAGSLSFVNSGAIASVNNSITANLANGTYAVYIGCMDKADNRANSSLINISVNCAPVIINDTNYSEGPVIYTINDNQFGNGYMQVLARFDRIRINTSINHQLIIVSSVGISSAILNVSSILSGFNIGDEKDFDTNADGNYDITVRLDMIISGRAVVSVKKYTAPDNPVVDTPVNQTPWESSSETPSDTNSGTNLILIIGIVAIVLIVGIIVAIFVIIQIKKRRMLGGSFGGSNQMIVR